MTSAIGREKEKDSDEVGRVFRNSRCLVVREHGIEVTAIHNHGLGEEPRLFYVHFWAHDDAVKLARGLHAALEKTNSAKSAAAR